MSYDLSKVANSDWGTHVPSLQGKFDSHDLDNLEDISKNVLLKENPEIVKKCWKFATVQDSGKKTFEAGSILKNNNIAAKQETVVFSDGKKQIDLFVLSALKKDYPNFNIKNLSKLTTDEFEDVIEYLYNDKPGPHIPELLKNIGIDDPILNFTVGSKMPKATDIEACPLNRLGDLFNALVTNYNARPHTDENRNDFSKAINAFTNRVASFDPKSKKDISAAADMYKAINDNLNLIDPSTASMKGITDRLQNTLSTSLTTSKELSAVGSLIRGLAGFFSKSLLNWFDVDQKYIMNALRGVPNLQLNMSKEVPESMVKQIATLDNLKKVHFTDKNMSPEFSRLLRENRIPLESSATDDAGIIAKYLFI